MSKEEKKGRGGSYIINAKTGERTLVRRGFQEDKTNTAKKQPQTPVDDKKKKG